MTRSLTEGNPTKLITSFAFTVLLGSLMNYIYNFTDSLMVGWFVNTNALGAISAVSAPLQVLNNLSTTIISGFSIVAGHLYGAGDHTRLRSMMANAVYLTTGITLLVTIVSLILCRPLIHLVNTPEELCDMAEIYMSIIILAKPFAAPSWLLSSMFRALGDTKIQVSISMVNGFSNVVFNFLFLVVFPMGIAGAAIGTLCAATLGSINYLYFLRKKVKLLHFGKKDAKPSLVMMKRLLGISLPVGMESAVTSTGSVILQTAINGHGTAAITGVAMCGKIMNLFWLVLFAFENSLLCFCAQNFGAGKMERVRRGIKSTLLIFLGVGGAAFVSALFGLDNLMYMAFVGNDAQILSFAHQDFMTNISFFPFISVLFACRTGLKAFGSTLPTLLCGVVELIARLFVSFAFSQNLQMLFFAGPMAWVASSVFVAILFPIVARKKENMHQPQLETGNIADLKANESVAVASGSADEKGANTSQ